MAAPKLSEVKDNLLKKLGFNLDDIADADFSLKESVEVFEAAQKTKFEKLFKNDTDYKKEITVEAENRIYGGLDGVLKKYLTPEEMADKSARDKISALAEKLSQNKSDDVKELQDKIHSLNGDLEKKDNEIDEVKKNEHARADSRIISTMLKDKLAAYSDDKLIGSRETVSRLIDSAMHNDYDFRLTDSNEIMILQKGSDKQAESGNDFLKVDQLITDTLTTEKLLVNSNGGSKGKSEDKSEGKPAGSKTEPGVRVSPKTKEKFDFDSGSTDALTERLKAKGYQVPTSQ